VTIAVVRYLVKTLGASCWGGPARDCATAPYGRHLGPVCFARRRTACNPSTPASFHQLLVQPGMALAIMTVVSIAIGWIIAGRVLRPIRTLTATTRRISERNLHERLALDGPRTSRKTSASTAC
jgi:HAMP domain